jgi:hypothetical protein
METLWVKKAGRKAFSLKQARVYSLNHVNYGYDNRGMNLMWFAVAILPDYVSENVDRRLCLV